jgi:hypothetical protein
MSVRSFLATCVIVLASGASSAGRDPIALLEVKVGTDRFEGRIAAHDENTCWLLNREGRLSSFRTDDVTDFHEIEARFRPYSSLDIRDKLQKEFGRDYEVKTTSHYVVVAGRGTANRYAAVFERIYRQFHTYVTARGFHVSDPEFPLVAVVLPNQKAFVDYCVGEGTPPQPGMLGFYLPSSNRVALYDRAASGQSTDDDVDDTVIHEGTHQVAFNTGVHSRIGPSPVWLVEGLATLFEADGIRKKETGDGVADRINPERLEWFHAYRKRRPANSLETFVREDSLFKKATLDAYSQAWSLTFFLAETRPVEFAKYLKVVATRNPLQSYDGDARVKDFRDAFGKDLEFVENGMLRFYDKLGQ